MIEKQCYNIGFTLTNDFLFALDNHIYKKFGVDFSNAHITPSYSDDNGNFFYNISHYIGDNLIFLNLVVKNVLPLAETNKSGLLLFRLFTRINEIQSDFYSFVRNKFRIDDINQAISSVNDKIKKVHSSMTDGSFSINLDFFDSNIFIAEGTCQIKSRKIYMVEIKEEIANSFFVKSNIKGLKKLAFIISSDGQGFIFNSKNYVTDEDLIHFNYDFLKMTINHCFKNDVYFDLDELENYNIDNIDDYLLVQQMVNI